MEIEFKNEETRRALLQFSPYAYALLPKTPKPRSLPAKIAYQKFQNGQPVLTLITRD